MHNPAMQRIIAGMIGAFGDAAHEEAQRRAFRLAVDDSEGEDIWRAIADEIERRCQPRPNFRPPQGRTIRTALAPSSRPTIRYKSAWQEQET